MSDLTTAPLMWVAKETGLWSMVSTTMVENPIACFDSLTLRTSVSQRLTAWRPVRSLGQMSRLVVRISGLIESPQSFDVRTTNSSSSRRAPPGSSTSGIEIEIGKEDCRRANAARRRASWSASATLARDLFHIARAQRRRRHGLEVTLDRRLDRGDHRTFDEGRVAEQDAAVAVRELLDRHLRAEHGAAEVDEDQHALGPTDLLDRAQDRGRVGAQPPVGGAAGHRDLHLALGHLGGELTDPFRQLAAVRDEHHANRAHRPSTGSRAGGRRWRP